ncbi:RDD family protein, partial [Candidatus Halobonum tyrrellensis]
MSSPPPPNGADLRTLGRRAVAAAVDHALVALLAAVAGVPLAVFGRVEPSLLVGVGTVVWFGYFAGLEALAGRTLGKRLLGLTVVTDAGGRPDAAAAAVRTLCRVVDWLPAGYLLGAAVVAVGADG